MVNPSQMTIVGIGPGSWEDLTLAAHDALLSAPAIVFRTLRHPVVESLRNKRPDLIVESFDSLYEETEEWDDLFARMAQSLIKRVQSGNNVLYAVPGHPGIGEASVRKVLAGCAELEIPVRIIGGISLVETLCARFEVDPLEHGLQIIDATELASLAPQQVSGAIISQHPLIITHAYNRRIASALKLSLLEIYPDSWQSTIIQAPGLQEERTETLPLCEMDFKDYADHHVYLPAIPPESLLSLRTAESLRVVVERLRAPNGCPWDRKQTHTTLLKYALDEAAEVADAIESFDDDPDHLAEELGDLLLQVYLHAEIAQEEGAFTINDVMAHITSKLIRRHPHVFGDVEVTEADQVAPVWDAIKKSERAAAGVEIERESILRGITRNSAALATAHTIQRKAVKAGFDWPTAEEWVTKLNEEVQEFLAAESREQQQDEFGDILFTLVALARRQQIDAELALRQANERFTRRFQMMETICWERNDDFAQQNRETHRALWQEAKRRLAE